jgi:EmrB/QacA subfamily drug resistance transporter
LSTIAPADAETAAESTPHNGKPIMSHRQILLVIYGLMAGMFLASLDQTIVGTAIRTIGDDLNGLNDQAWVTTAYLITSTIAVPIYGKLSDQFGRRPLYIFGIVVFLIGSLMSSFSTSMLMLAGFRAFQGIGAGALMSLPLAIMGDILAPRERAKYQGYFLAVFGVSSVIGPLIGGLFAGTPQILFITGWRWVFLINIPIGIIALLMVLAFLHLPKFSTHAKPRIDWFGAASVVITLVPILLVAEEGRTWGWTSAGSISCYIIAAVGLAMFLFVENRMKADAIIPLSLFRSRVFSQATVLGLLVGFGMFGAMLTLPLYLQIVFGLSPTASGFATLPMMAGLLIASIGSGQIIARTGKYGFFPITGTLVLAAGFLVLTFITYDKPIWFIFIAMFLIGLGLGQLMQTLTLATQNAVQPHQIGVATGSSTFFRQIGGTLGVAVLLSVLFAVLPGNVTNTLKDKDTLTSSLSAALTPSIANAPKNAGVMKEIWNKSVTPLQAGVQKKLTAAVAAAEKGLPESAYPQVLAGVAKNAHASVVGNSVQVDWANASQRNFWVKTLVPTIEKSFSSLKASSGSTSDTSFLNGATPALTKPFKVGFNTSVVGIYWIGLGVIGIAFLLALFFRPPPLRKTSAMQERADAAGVTETGRIKTQA